MSLCLEWGHRSLSESGSHANTPMRRGGESVTFGWLSKFGGFAQLVLVLDLEMICFLA